MIACTSASRRNTRLATPLEQLGAESLLHLLRVIGPHLVLFLLAIVLLVDFVVRFPLLLLVGLVAFGLLLFRRLLWVRVRPLGLGFLRGMWGWPISRMPRGYIDQVYGQYANVNQFRLGYCVSAIDTSIWIIYPTHADIVSSNMQEARTGPGGTRLSVFAAVRHTGTGDQECVGNGDFNPSIV